MRTGLLLLLLMGTVWAETWKWSDSRGNWAEVKYSQIPAQTELVEAFKKRFFPMPQSWIDADFRSSWETEVEVGLSTTRFYSAVSRGITMMRDSKGNPLGAHPGKLAQTLTWDLKKNQEVSLRQLVRADALPALLELIRKGSEFPEAFSEQAEWDFFLTPEGVVFFDRNAPHVAFGLESTVPYTQLKPLAGPDSPVLLMLPAVPATRPRSSN